MVFLRQIGTALGQGRERRLQSIQFGDRLLQPLLALTRIHVAAGRCLQQPQRCRPIQGLKAIATHPDREAFLGWYLLYEQDQVGQEQGLICSERLDRLALRQREPDLCRSLDDHQVALQRLERLLHHSGGIFFGTDLQQQLAVASPSPQRRRQALLTLRFCCAPWAFAFIREGLQRYPIDQLRLAKPLPTDRWWHHPQAPHVLEPGSAADSHPYPVELDLPPWTIAADIDLRNWLFAFAGGIRIHSPDALRLELLQRCHQAINANDGLAPPASSDA